MQDNLRQPLPLNVDSLPDERTAASSTSAPASRHRNTSLCGTSSTIHNTVYVQPRLHDLSRLYESSREPGQLPYMLSYLRLSFLFVFRCLVASLIFLSRAVCFVTPGCVI